MSRFVSRRYSFADLLVLTAICALTVFCFGVAIWAVMPRGKPRRKKLR